MAKDDWMKQTKGGKRTSPYTEPKREKVRREKGNVADVIREKNQRTERDSY